MQLIQYEWAYILAYLRLHWDTYRNQDPVTLMHRIISHKE